MQKASLIEEQVSDFTYVSAGKGLICVDFAIDTFAGRIVALRDLHANPFRVTDGGCRGRPGQTVCPMLWNKHGMTDVRFRKAV